MSIHTFAPFSQQFRQARENLTRVVAGMAALYAKSYGISYAASPVAPETLGGIVDAYNLSKETGAPFPVWEGESENTIYTGPHGNFAFRFWHDMLHMEYSKHTTVDDEVWLGERHVATIANIYGEHSLEARMMWADTCGQSLYHQAHGEFPKDQLAFVGRTILGA